MALIELGDVSAPGVPPGERLGTHRDFRRWRGTVVTAVAVVAAATLHAAAPPGATEPTVRPAWSVPSGNVLGLHVDADSVYVHQAVDGRAALTAYDVGTGAVRWSRPTGAGVDVSYPLDVDAEGGAVYLPLRIRMYETTAEDGSTAGTEIVLTSGAVDTVTGERRWELPGSVYAHTPDAVLMSERTPRGEIATWRLVRARTGETIWRRPGGGAQDAQLAYRDGRPVAVVLTGESRPVTVLDFTDGRTLRSRPLAGHVGSHSDASKSVFTTVAGDQLYLHRSDEKRSTITAYRLDTLTELWHTDRPGWVTAFRCGPTTCLSSRDALAGLDPATGRQRWERPGYDLNLESGREDRLWVGTGSGEDRYPGDVGPWHLLDSATGRLLGAGMRGQPLRTAPGAEHALVLRSSQKPGEPASIRHVDLATGESILVGGMPDPAAEEFHAYGPHIVALRGGRLEVTVAG